MPIWSLISLISIIIIVYALIRKQRKENVPILINGVIPGKPDAKEKKDSGSTIYMYFDSPEGHKEVFRGYADEEGKVSASVSRKNIGDSLSIRIRHAGFKPIEITRKISKYGLFHTAQMELDGVYLGDVRGAPPENLNTLYTSAIESAEEIKLNAIAFSQMAERSLGEIPWFFWLLSYILLILGFAGDYYSYQEMLNVQKLDSFTHAVYFSTVTITTLGYGEIHPIHDMLRIVSSVQAVSGLVLVGLFLNSLFYERKLT